MQQIFHTTKTPEEYQQLGRDFPFPVPDRCPNPGCLVKVPMQRHGFYTRNVIAQDFSGRIPIRRYYCKYCGKTLSYLPSFCLPYYQYTLGIIFSILCLIVDERRSLRVALRILKQLNLTQAHLQFYVRRFLDNQNRIKLGLRQLVPNIFLPPRGEEKKEGARKILNIVAAGFPQIQTFSRKYYTQCKYSFMAPLSTLF